MGRDITRNELLELRARIRKNTKLSGELRARLQSPELIPAFRAWVETNARSAEAAVVQDSARLKDLQEAGL